MSDEDELASAASSSQPSEKALPRWRSPSGRFKVDEWKAMLPKTRTPYFVGSGSITLKDKLLRNLRKFKAVHGSVFAFYPETYTLPLEYEKFVTAFCAQSEADPGSIWIGKPAELSRGRGIFLFRDLANLQYNTKYVVQKYVDNPLLISGFKFDLRLYVLVTSVYPLRVFLYRDGLARFSTQRYDKGALENLYAHLTNCSINKHSPTLLDGKGAVGPGCKWSFAELWAHLRRANVDLERLWGRVRAIICLTLLSLATAVKKGAPAAFELYGFDVLLDADLKPWLLEVNAAPALGLDGPVDALVKEPMLADLMAAVEGEDRLDAAAAPPRAAPARILGPRPAPRPAPAARPGPPRLRLPCAYPSDPPAPPPPTDLPTHATPASARTPQEEGSTGTARAAGPSPPAFEPPDGRPSRWGGFDLIFPFNAATHEIAQRARLPRARPAFGGPHASPGGGRRLCCRLRERSPRVARARPALSGPYASYKAGRPRRI
eukprot:tig00001428_g8728.t1